MDPRLQRRIQRYGWDLAADRYEAAWREPLEAARRELLAQAALRRGERVLDVACGTGLVAFAAAECVGPGGEVTGVDVSERMVDAALRHERERRGDATRRAPLRFQRMDAESLEFADARFDVALCALGLMYLPDPERALVEMRRVLRPGGRVVIAVWGERSRCGWAPLFPIVDAEVASDVCPLFFRLGAGDALAAALAGAGFADVRLRRVDAPFEHVDDGAAVEAAFHAGPVALAWSRLDTVSRARVQARYLEALAPFRRGSGFHVDGEFVVASGTRRDA